MKGRWRRFTAMLLACLMLFGLLFPDNAFAAENSGTELEAAVQAEGADNLDTAADGSLTESDIENISAAAAYIREQMTQRETVITGSLEISGMENMNSVFEALADQIFIYTSESDEGDYLKQHSGGMAWNYEASFDGNVTTFSYELQISYYTTLEQEQEVADRIDEVLADLSLDGLSDYEKAKEIYNYIAVNVSYDYEHLGDSSYMLSHTAYAALIQKTAVCQGYASLFYRMAHEAGLSVRIVTGLVDGEAHAWNMVKIGDLYYYVDATHASSSGNRDDYFLKGSISFADRQLDSDYLSADFTSEFPMSDFDYSDDSGNTEVGSGELTSSIQWCVKSSTDEEGKTTYYLELQGNGEIPDYAQNDELPWEEWRDEITVVTVGSGITKIGSYVFADMDALTTVQIANTVTALGDGAFYNCGKLTNLQIPDSVTFFGNFVIGGTYGKTQWEYNPVEKKLTVTGDGAMGEPYVEGSTTEKNASCVPWNRYRDQIEEVVIEEGVVNLSTYALHGMTSLTAVTLPSTLEEIGEGSFESCTALTYICIPDSVKTIGHYAFRYCEGLRSIHIPASVTTIGVRAFSDCPYLHEFYFYGDAPEFNDQAIMDSEYITIYYDGSGWSDVKALFDYLTFETWEPGEYDDSGTNVSGEGIKSQTSGKYGEDIEWNYDEASAVLTLSGKGEMQEPVTIMTQDETTGAVTISYSTNAVPWDPFSTQIKVVDISDGITSITRYAFYWLSQLESITIPDSVTTIGKQSFVHCVKLQSLTFGDDLMSIGEEAFKDCTALKEIYLSDNLANVDKSAFSGCEALTDVYYEGSENEWEEIVIGENNEPILNATIHFNYGNEPEINDKGTLTIGAAYSVLGEKDYITGNYVAKNPNNIEEELDSINWRLEDSSLADLGQFSYILSADRTKATIMLEYTPQKYGETVIIGELSEDIGDDASAEVITEPAIILPQNNSAFVNNYDANIVINGTDYLTLKVQLNESDPDYIKSFMESFNVEIEIESVSSSNEIIELKNQGYIISEDGSSGEYIIPLEITDEDKIDNVITISTKAQKKTVRIIYNNPLIDYDLDGIPDIWEEEGIDTDKDGNIDLDLPAMGAVVGHKDIFVEVDIMEGLDIPESVLKNSFEYIAKKFLEHGYYLHIDAGSDSIDYVTGNEWGSLSESNSITYEEVIHLYDESYNSDGDLVDSDYSYWDTLTEQYLSDVRNAVFRHCILINDYEYTKIHLNSDNSLNESKTESGSSGVSMDTPSQSFIVNMGSLVKGSTDADNKLDIEYLENIFTGTFMHELGHTLGLLHGGEDNVNYKPNNLSIMNYLYQMDGLNGTNEYTYSEYELPALDENDINEFNGIDPEGTISDTDLGISWILTNSNGEEGETYDEKNISGREIDFNKNDIIEDNVKINFFHGGLKPDDWNGINTGSINEWDSLILKGGSIGDLGATSPLFKFESHPQNFIEEDLTVEKAIDLGILDAPTNSSHTHELNKINAKDATCITEGNVDYYICEACGKTFIDEEGTVEVKEDDIIIPATGHTYKYTDNGDGTHIKSCTSGDDTVTEPHTYQDGICTLCGAEEPKEHAHEYGTPEFKWSEDYQTCVAVFTCKDGDDQQNIECEVTDEITDATCTENGKAVYTAKGTFDGKEYTDVKEVEIPASGHAYGTPEFNWSDDYTTCTAVFICESCNDEQKIECDITSETTDPTCTGDGKTVYTATVSFTDKEYTDTQEEVITATGHTYEYTDNGDGTHTKVCTAGDDTAAEPHTYQDGTCTYCGAEEPKEHIHEYGTPEFNWSEDYTTCTAVFTCKDGDDQQSIKCEVTDEVTDATCTENGKASYTAKVTFGDKEYTDVKEQEIPASGHTYGTPEFNWSEDYQTCTAVITCESCDDEQKMECDIVSETTDPTCTEDGKTVYTATVAFEGKEYTDTQEEVIPAAGHTYEYMDNGDGTHTKVCTAGDDTTTEPHIYQDGICISCGAEEPEEHEHVYGEPEFTWSEDNQTCTAIFTCKNGDDKQKVECKVASETTDPTCTEAGKTVYTATALFGDQEYTDTKEEEIPAAGHSYEYTDNGDGTHTKVCTIGDDTAAEPHTYQDGICVYCRAEEPEGHVHEYGEPEFIWSDDCKNCTIVFTCADGDDQQKIECEVTSEITDATCTENGKAVYTAKGSFNGEEYSDMKEEEIPASGHAYGEPVFSWSEDYQSCTAVFTCESGDDEQSLECEVVSETTEPTCTASGKTVYTATVLFNDKEYLNTQEETIVAAGHTYEYRDNGDGTHTKTCTVGDDSKTEPHTYQDGICAYCGAEEPKEHVHEYGEPEFSWADDFRSCTAAFTCTDNDDQQTVECTVESKDNGDGTVTYTAVAEFNETSYTDTQTVKIPEKSEGTDNTETPTGTGEENKTNKPTAGTANASSNKTNNKTATKATADDKVVSSAKTGDDTNAALWILLLAAAGATGVMIVRSKKKMK